MSSDAAADLLQLALMVKDVGRCLKEQGERPKLLESRQFFELIQVRYARSGVFCKAAGENSLVEKSTGAGMGAWHIAC
jgi:hypothetical protein